MYLSSPNLLFRKLSITLIQLYLLSALWMEPIPLASRLEVARACSHRVDIPCDCRTAKPRSCENFDFHYPKTFQLRAPSLSVHHSNEQMSSEK